MAALAEILVARGAKITGSDVSDVFYTDEIIKKLGIVAKPFSAENITDKTQFVIHSSAYSTSANPDLIEATKRNIPISLYTEALGSYSAQTFSCGIAGVHGKTSTTGIVGTILKELNFPSQILAGSVINSFDNSCTCNIGNKYFVAETCEYQRHFMSFHPQKIILTSVESDHQDCYPTYEAILAAFMQYISLLPDMGEVIYCADDDGACEAVKMIYTSRPDLVYTSYGEKAIGDFHVNIEGVKEERLCFSINGFPGVFKLRVPGHHMVKNATAAIALAVSLVIKEKGELTSEDLQLIRSGLEKFTGAKRRSEIIGEEKNILIMDDYGHHPTAIKTTLAGLKEFYPNRRIIVDFMSHTYSRTAALLDEFAGAFEAADMVVLHKIYSSARETYQGGVNGRTLFGLCSQKHPNVTYFDTFEETVPFLLEKLQPNNLFITMGAGDNWKIGQRVLEELKKR